MYTNVPECTGMTVKRDALSKRSSAQTSRVTTRSLGSQLSPRAFPSRRCILIGSIDGTGSLSLSRARVCAKLRIKPSLRSWIAANVFNRPFALDRISISSLFPLRGTGEPHPRRDSIQCALLLLTCVSRDGQLPLIPRAHLSLHLCRRFCFTDATAACNRARGDLTPGEMHRRPSSAAIRHRSVKRQVLPRSGNKDANPLSRSRISLFQR